MVNCRGGCLLTSNISRSSRWLHRMSICTFLPKIIFERHDEYMYLKLVQEIISSGAQKDDRTGTGTLSKFGCQVVRNSDYLCIFVLFIFVILLILFILQFGLTDNHLCFHLSNTCTLCRCVSIFVDLFRFLQQRYQFSSGLLLDYSVFYLLLVMSCFIPHFWLVFDTLKRYACNQISLGH